MALVLVSVDMFLVVLVFALVIWLVVVMEQRDGSAIEAANLLFKLAGAEHANRQVAADYDAVLKRFTEVLDEHALCPVPVKDVVDPDLGERIVRNIAAYERRTGRRP